MALQRKKLPEGVQDFLPEECKCKRELEETLRQEFLKNGFLEVETPSFEYYDVFSKGIGAYMEEHMIKFIDNQGRILALRPDLTVPIARMAALALPPEEKHRLFYIQNAFGVSDYSIGQRSEFTQAGVEYLGKAGSGADAEIAALAIKCLLKTGLKDFKLDMGQVGFFKGIVQDAGLEEECVEELRSLIDSKNTVELEYKLSALALPQELKEKLLALPGLFGGGEVLKKARELSDTPACQAAIDNLEEVYEALLAFGYGDYLSLDLGMLHKLNYYSGVIFRGISQEMGFPLLSGGRYDGLNGEFGTERPAVGFALGLKRVLIALERQGDLSPQEQDYILVAVSGAAGIGEGNLFAQKRRSAGQTVVLEIVEKQEELAAYREEKSCRAIYYFDNGAKVRLK